MASKKFTSAQTDCNSGANISRAIAERPLHPKDLVGFKVEALIDIFEDSLIDDGQEQDARQCRLMFELAAACDGKDGLVSEYKSIARIGADALRAISSIAANHRWCTLAREVARTWKLPISEARKMPDRLREALEKSLG